MKKVFIILLRQDKDMGPRSQTIVVCSLLWEATTSTWIAEIKD